MKSIKESILSVTDDELDDASLDLLFSKDERALYDTVVACGAKCSLLEGSARNKLGVSYLVFEQKTLRFGTERGIPRGKNILHITLKSGKEYAVIVNTFDSDVISLSSHKKPLHAIAMDKNDWKSFANGSFTSSYVRIAERSITAKRKEVQELSDVVEILKNM